MNKGVIYALAAYGMWGFFPLYFKLLQQVPATQILTHRMVWSFVLLALALSIRKEWKKFRANLTPRVVITYLIAAVLLSVNWYVYIWGVNAGFIVEASLGYFINPLVNVLLGTVFLREKLTPFQWIPVGIATLGVIYLTVNYGQLPWIALTLAFTFGLYGLMKKLAKLNPLHGLSLETLLLLVPALIFLFLEESRGVGAFGHLGLGMDVMIAISGVLTALPLLLFAAAAHRIPLTTMGIIQYIAPTLQFLIGVALYHEPFTEARVVGFCMIWLALILYTANGLMERRKAMAGVASPTNPSASGS